LTSLKKLEGIDYIDMTFREKQPTIILLHGYGANMRDLAPLATLSPELKNYNWIFPDGTLEVPIGPFMKGKAWFPIDMEELNQAMMTGNFESLFSKGIPEGLEDCATRILKFIEALKKEKSSQEIILGGFSQGSMLALYLTLIKGMRPTALLLLSSTLIGKKELGIAFDKENQESLNLLSIPIFQSHGVSDPVLPISMARALHEFLKEKKMKVDYQEFPGGHEIPPTVMGGMISFLKDNLYES